MSELQSRVDVAANRQAQKWTRKEQIGRVLWAVAAPFFRWSPRPFWGWRRGMLRLFGARVGRDVHVYPTVSIAIPWNLNLEDSCAIGDHAILYALGPIRVGPRATVSQFAHLCAGSHDLDGPDRALLKRPIAVGADAWIAADAFVGAGVTVGSAAVVGARAVVMKDVAPAVVMVGNPAKMLRRLNP